MTCQKSNCIINALLRHVTSKEIRCRYRPSKYAKVWLSTYDTWQQYVTFETAICEYCLSNLVFEILRKKRDDRHVFFNQFYKLPLIMSSISPNPLTEDWMRAMNKKRLYRLSRRLLPLRQNHRRMHKYTRCIGGILSILLYTVKEEYREWRFTCREHVHTSR